MQFHVGRLIDHVHLRVRDLDASKTFYTAVLDALGIPVGRSNEHFFQADELFIDAMDTGGTPSKVHLAFQARDKDIVAAFYKAALAAGGRDNGAPGERPYHPGYYGAYVFDPDGNNIEAVFHGPEKRSAASVIREPA